MSDYFNAIKLYKTDNVKINSLQDLIEYCNDYTNSYKFDDHQHSINFPVLYSTYPELFYDFGETRKVINWVKTLEPYGIIASDIGFDEYDSDVDGIDDMVISWDYTQDGLSNKIKSELDDEYDTDPDIIESIKTNHTYYVKLYTDKNIPLKFELGSENWITEEVPIRYFIYTPFTFNWGIYTTLINEKYLFNSYTSEMYNGIVDKEQLYETIISNGNENYFPYGYSLNSIDVLMELYDKWEYGAVFILW